MERLSEAQRTGSPEGRGESSSAGVSPRGENSAGDASDGAAMLKGLSLRGLSQPLLLYLAAVVASRHIGSRASAVFGLLALGLCWWRVMCGAGSAYVRAR